MRSRSLIRRSFPYRQYNAVLILIGINVALFLFTRAAAPRIVALLALTPLPLLQRNLWWQLLTYMFVHANFTHILFNMLGLFFFGTQVERRIGSHEFLLFYLATGVLAGLFSLGFYLFFANPLVVLVGASGAVFAVLLAFATLFPDAVIYVFGILPLRAPLLVIIYTAISVFSQVSGRGGNVAHFTHLAGFAFAYLYLFVRMGLNPARIFRDSLR